MVRSLSNRNLPHLFLRVRESFLCHFRPLLHHFDITEQQWRILRALSERGEMEQREICGICDIVSPSMAGILSRMEELELIRRQRLPGDMRRVSVRLANKGERIMNEMAPLVEAQFRHIEKVFGEDLIERLFAVLDEAVKVNVNSVKRVELPRKGAAEAVRAQGEDNEKRKSGRQAKAAPSE